MIEFDFNVTVPIHVWVEKTKDGVRLYDFELKNGLSFEHYVFENCIDDIEKEALKHK